MALRTPITVSSLDHLPEAAQALIYKHGAAEVRHQLATLSGYARRVPSITEFLDDPEFLGDPETDSCVINIFPIWRTFLEELFPNPYSCRYKEVLLSVAVGGGKTTVALVAAAYDLVRLLCLKNPHKYLGTGKTKALTIACVNRSRDLAKAVLYDQMILLFQESPFMSGKLKEARKQKLKTLFPNNIDLIYGSRGSQILGTDIFCAILSELAFANTTKTQAYDVYTNAVRRFQSRFLYAKSQHNLYPGRIYVDSSLSDDASFINDAFLKGKQRDPECKVAMFRYWELHGHREGLYSGETFWVFSGTFEEDPRILEDDEEPGDDLDRYLEVPVEHRKAFEDDLISALQDIANVITQSTHSWLPGAVAIDLATRDVPCTRDLIQLEKHQPLVIPYSPDPHDAPRYIGLDLSKSGDKTGIAISYIRGFRETKDSLGIVHRTPIVRTELAVALKNAKSCEIPIGQIRDWIKALKMTGLTIGLVTADQYQSATIIQDLNDAGIPAELLSVDRTMVAYDRLRQSILERTAELPNSPLLRFELKNLEVVKAGSSDKKKVDHKLGEAICPETQRTLPFSKDVSDAVTQSHYSAVTQGGADAIVSESLQAYFEYADTLEKVGTQDADAASITIEAATPLTPKDQQLMDQLKAMMGGDGEEEDWTGAFLDQQWSGMGSV